MNEAEILSRQQQLVDGGYNIGNTGVGGAGVDGIWGDKSKAAWNKHRIGQLKGAIGGVASGVGGMLGSGLGALTGAGDAMQGNVQNQLAQQNTLSDGSILNQGDAGYQGLNNVQRLQNSAGGMMSGIGNTGQGLGSAGSSFLKGNMKGGLQGLGQAGKGAVGAIGGAIGGLSAGAGMLGSALKGVEYGAKY